MKNEQTLNPPYHQYSFYNNVAELEGLIRHHQRLYYDLHEPEISDKDFDVLWDRLMELCPSSPVLTERSQFDADYSHAFPMGSLSKCKSISEVVSKLGGKSKDNVGVITAKLDGASMALHYENGRLVRAVTRGRTDTGKGKIVTANALKINGIPKDISHICKDKLEVRGECIIFLDDWQKIADKYKNPRNAASGGISCKDARETEARMISFVACKAIAWKTSKSSGIETPFDYQSLTELERMGFKVPRYVKVNLSSVQDVQEAIDNWLKDRDSLPYWNDGIVIRISDNDVYNDMGFTGVCPNGACAYKFENQQTETIIRDIEWTTSRIGFVTPVAVFDPVELGGATITRCTLNNPTWMREHGNPTIGSRVIVAKMNDIIPNIVSVLEAGSGDTKEPKNCPSCGSELSLAETADGDGAKLKCSNDDCPAKFIKRIRRMLEVLEVKGIDETTLIKMDEAGLLDNLLSIFYIHKQSLMNAGFGPRESELFVQSLSDVSASPEIIIAAAGIEGWGRRMVRHLIEKSDGLFTPERLMNGEFTYDDLVKVPGVGPAKAKVLADAFVSGGYGKSFLSEIVAKVKIAWPTSKPTGGKLNGLSFCLSGSMPRGKKQIEADIVANGGTVSSGVSKKLSYLVAGEGSGSKSEAAAKNGVKVISEDELYAMMV